MHNILILISLLFKINSISYYFKLFFCILNIKINIIMSLLDIKYRNEIIKLIN